ncbi:MAG: hypothetical protein ACTSX9_07170 [Candidatus Njordarchaeales archaeon]
MIKISVLVDKRPKQYKGFGETLMRGFFIAYFDIRDSLEGTISFDDFIMSSILMNGKFVGEDIPDEAAEDVINYLEEHADYKRELRDHLLYVLEDGHAFLDFFEEKLKGVLKEEYYKLLKRISDA